MNDLRRYFEENTRNLIHKVMHYFEIYERYFHRYRGTEVHILEVGVKHGGSLQMWKDYFGERAHIYGVDINPDCKGFEEDRIRIFIGDQADQSFLEQLTREIPRIDILIDDGGHTMEQQIATFEVLYPHLAPDGIYLCEDTMTSYWERYGGGYRKPGTFVEYCKGLIDPLYAWHAEEPEHRNVSQFTQSTFALHFYDGVVVFEKRPIEPPEVRMMGTPMLPQL